MSKKKSDAFPEHMHQEITNSEADAPAKECSCSDWKSQYLRVHADLQNFQRRVSKEQIQWTASAEKRILERVLNIVDDVDRALAEGRKLDIGDHQRQWLDGFEMIAKSLYDLLQAHQVTETSHMHTFDPALHEAIAQIDSPDHESGQIIEVLQKGFMFKDSVLRPARVTVAA